MRNSIVLLTLAGLLASCGLKGPLYLPQQQKPAAGSPVAVPVVQSDDKKSPEISKK